MHQIYNMLLEAGLASALLLPVLLILNHIRFRNYKVTFFYFLFTAYLAGIYAVVGLPNVSYLRFEINANLIPFMGMVSDLTGTILNVTLFIPLGIFLYLLWKRYRSITHALLFGFTLSVSIELLQIFTLRATDVNDLITNTAGALIGWLIGFTIGRIFPSLKGRNRESDLPVLIVCSAAVMFFFQPIIWRLIY